MANCRIAASVLLILFAALLGRVASRARFPAYPRNYTLSGEFQPMRAAPQAEPRKALYLRRTWHLSEVPDSAWVKVIGHDVVGGFVNDRSIGRARARRPGAKASLAANITAFLREGENCIAISVRQDTFASPPEVAVEAGYQLQNGEQHDLNDPSQWRYSHDYECRNTVWHASDFDDALWKPPVVGDKVHWRAPCSIPPELASNEFHANWIRPRETISGSAALRRTFQLDGRPRHGWLRVITTAPHGLAINGVRVVDESLDPSMPFRSMHVVHDVSPLLRSGRNTIAIEMTTTGHVPHVAAELTVSNSSGPETPIQTDEQWLSLGGRVPNWLAEDLDTSHWASAVVEPGEVGVLSRRLRLAFETISLPAGYTWNFLGFQLLISVALGVVAGIGVWVTGNLLCRHGNMRQTLARSAPLLALVPSILIASLGILADWDSAVWPISVYSWSCLAGLVALPVLQWGGMVLVAPIWRKTARATDASSGFQKPVGTVLLLAVCLIALWLRVADIYRAPIHHDEIAGVLWAEGFWEQGFPAIDVHPDLPMGYAATSELVHLLNAPMLLLTDDPRTVVRVPTVFWSMATLVLLCFYTRRLCGFQVAFVAGVIYAVSPYLVAMATFGRYFAQVQFFAILSFFAFWETIRGPGPINRRALWLTTFAFCAMYLSWEGTALVAPGMALAALFQRRGRWRTFLLCPSIHAAVATVALVVGLQNAHRISIQSQRFIFGAGIDVMSLTPMWQNQFFFPDYYFKAISWNADALLPLIAMVLAVGIAVCGHRTHAWLRVFLIIALTPPVLMTLFIPLRALRYAYHLTPISILFFSFVLVRAAAALSRLGRDDSAPRWLTIHARVVTAAFVALTMVPVSGHFLQTDKLAFWSIPIYRDNQLRFANWTNPFNYIRENLQEGDVVISSYPHLTDFLLGRRSDYWLQTTMKRQATLDDRRPIPLERGAGVPVVVNRKHLEQIFSQNKRIWYCTIPYVHEDLNDLDVSEYVFQHMEVVYEDFKTVVLLHDSINRPVETRTETNRARAYRQ